MDIKETTLEEIARHLDISPTDFERARSRYTAVRNWLNGGNYYSGSAPDVYLQGSFRLGTVVRPYKGDREGAFDIDQVCELSIPLEPRAPERLKADIGDRLRENVDYSRMLDEEGKRCWTLQYTTADNAPEFHIDILPSLPSLSGPNHQIDITNRREDSSYSWSISNPKAYYYWFKARNEFQEELTRIQRATIFLENRELYESEGDVPLQLVRTPLQRSIQLMKRHRDVYFSAKNHAPISIIITTIATQLPSRVSVIEIISDFANYVIQRHTELLRDGQLRPDGNLEFYDGEWSILNPVTVGTASPDISPRRT